MSPDKVYEEDDDGNAVSTKQTEKKGDDKSPNSLTKKDVDHTYR